MSNTASPEPLRIAGIVPGSIVDGPGIRFVVFTQGCPHGCPGCHNPDTHDPKGGSEADIPSILARLDEDLLLSGVTFSGGEPFMQAAALVPLAEAVKVRGKNLMVYTGYQYEQLVHMEQPGVQRLLSLADLLVDGPYVEKQRDLTLPYRGSANQRVIDLKKTRDCGTVTLYQSEY